MYTVHIWYFLRGYSINEFTDDLRHRLWTVWKDVEGLNPQDTNSKLATCQSFFAVLHALDGQYRILTPYLTVDLVVFLPKIPYTHRIYIWFWPTLGMHAPSHSLISLMLSATHIFNFPCH